MNGLYEVSNLGKVKAIEHFEALNRLWVQGFSGLLKYTESEYDNSNILLDLIQKQDTEINKLNKVIDRMAEDIIEYQKDLKYEYPYETKEEVKEYYMKLEQN